MFKNIRVFIQPKDVYQYFLDHIRELEDNMIMIASTDTDDFDKKSFLFMTNNNGDLFLSLETPDEIVDSSYFCFNSTNTENTICFFLEMLDKSTPIVMHKNTLEEYRCVITNEIDKYLLNLHKDYYSYLYDFGPFKDSNSRNVYAYSIRSPGSTKGHIFVNENNTIIEFKIYDDSLKYFKSEVKDLEKEFIGYELIKEVKE